MVSLGQEAQEQGQGRERCIHMILVAVGGLLKSIAWFGKQEQVHDLT